jgi:hypothetical protein
MSTAGDRAELREGASILKEAIFNQYQAIIAAGAGLLSLVGLTPVPLLVWLGTELVLLPLIDTPPVRRLVYRKRIEQRRQAFAAWRQQAIASLEPEQLKRFQQMEDLCRQIETNYQPLHGISRLYLSEQREKLDHILTSCLHRMLALRTYRRMLAETPARGVDEEIARLELELQQADLIPRVRAALEKNLELKRTLKKAQQEAVGTRRALETELDSMQALLEVLYQKSVSLRDPQAISDELDAIVRHAEDSERMVREMESLLRSSGAELYEPPALPAAVAPRDASRTGARRAGEMRGRVRNQ